MIRRPKQTAVQETAPPAASTSDQGNAGLFAAVFGTSDRYSRLTAADISGAKKVDPKVFFSKERTFLAWMHTSLWLAGASMAITAYSDTGTVSAIYGLMMLPVAIIFIIYAMLQCKKMLSYLIDQHVNFLIRCFADSFFMIRRKKELYASDKIAWAI